jgi:hypothetical protein
MNHPKLDAVIALAQAALGPRADYARRVIDGRQRWSGADLRGKARKYSLGYHLRRNDARIALFDAGGVIVAGPRGLLSTAVVIGVDDYGVQLYATTEWGVVPATLLR